MAEPLNPAAEQIVRSQSIITDLTAQLKEVQSAIGRQQALIEALTPAATWGDSELEPGEAPTSYTLSVDEVPQHDHPGTDEYLANARARAEESTEVSL